MSKTFNKKEADKEEINKLLYQIRGKLNNFETLHGEEFPIVLKVKEEYDYINPTHYVQADGRQTWERMLDKWSAAEVALWCEMTVFKYEDRIGKKPNEDDERELDKIKWYSNKADELYKLSIPLPPDLAAIT
mgnify:CR=1 FL=1